MNPAVTDARGRTGAFARVIGPFVTVVTTVYAIRLPELNAMIADILGRPVGVFALGVLLLGGGLVIVGGHRNWRGPAAVTVSLFGWFVTVRGLLLIAAPGTVQSSVDTVMASPSAVAAFRVFFAALALVGLFLTWVGWFGDRRSRPSRCRVAGGADPDAPGVTT